MVLSVFAISCQNNREPLKTKEIQNNLQGNLALNTIVISNAKGYEKDTLNIAFVHTESDFINDIERKKAEDFFKNAIKEDGELMNWFANINIQQSTKVIKNDAGILGFLIEQSNDGDKKIFTRYYDVAKKKQILASEIFYPKEKFQSFTEFVRTKSPNQDIDLEATDENYTAFEFDKNGNLTLYFNEEPPIKISREEVALYAHRNYREVFNYPPPIDCGKVPCVALTFDDGPSVHTPKLLDILKENDAKATFFVLGIMVNQYPEILKRTHQEGHQIGNHTWNHKDLKKLTKQGVEYQILETNKIIKEKIGQEPTILRPPYGSFNPMVATTANMPIILWDIDPLDWKNRNTKDVVNRMVKAERNSIILAHDIHKTTIDAIPLAIKELKAKGFHFVTVEDLFYGMELKKGETYNKRN